MTGTLIMSTRKSSRWAPCDGRYLAVALFAMIAAGCASVPADLGRGEVDDLARARGVPVPDSGAVESARELTQTLTAEPLTVENAVKVALINSPALEAEYASLGFAAADVYEGGRIRNPVFSWVRLSSNEAGAEDQVTLGLVTSLTDLLTLPARKRLSAQAFAAAKQSVGATITEIVSDVEKAYYHYVGAQQVAALRAQVAKAAELSAALAGRFHDAGNLSARDLALERAAASEAQIDALEAEADSVFARAEFAAVAGLHTDTDWSVPGQLRLPVDAEDDLAVLLTLANQSRLDLQAAKTNVEVLAEQRDLTEWSRWINELDVGYERERETDGSRIDGPLLDWEVPVFSTHRDVLMRTDADLRIALAELQRVLIDVNNGVRLAYADVSNARARIREYGENLIPQRIEAVARAQEEVNFMLIGVFELIATKQQEYDAYQSYLNAIRDYWVARSDLGRAVGRSLPSNARIGSERLDVQEFIEPRSAGMDHSGHGSMDRSDESGTVDHSGHAAPSDTRMDQESLMPDDAPMDHSQHLQMPTETDSQSGSDATDESDEPEVDEPGPRHKHDGGAR